MTGRTIKLLRPVYVVDRFNNRVADGYTEEVVHNVLIQPGKSIDLGPDRPDGEKVDLTLHFPKSYDGAPLSGCLVELPGSYASLGRLRVVGEPVKYEYDCPTKWNMSVGLEVSHG